MESIVDLILDYGVAIGLALLVIFTLLILRSDTLRGQMKKGVIYLLVFFGLGIGYYLVTGKSVTQLPADIGAFFGDPQVKDEPTHRYYREPEENYGKEVNED